MKIPNVGVPSLPAVMVLTLVFALPAQQTTIQPPGPGQIDAGGPISLHLKFDKPLPPAANVRVEISPLAATQWIPLSSGDPDDASRTAFTLKGVLPENAVPGEWVVRNVWLFLPGSDQGQPLGHNNATFRVKGKEFSVPSRADITITK